MSKSLYLIYGNDEYLVTAKTRTTIDSLVPKAEQAVRLDVLDGAVDTVDAAVACIRACLAALQSMGLFSSQRTVWLRDALFIGDTRAGRSDNVLAAMGRLTDVIKAGLPDGVSLVISAPTVDKRRSFFKACKAVGELHEFTVAEKGYQQERQAGERLAQLVTKSGLTMASDVQTAFLGCTGADTRQIVNEFEKLRVYVGDRTRVTKADVLAVCSTTRETAAWDLADAFGQRNLSDALGVLRRLLFQRENPIGLLIGLESRIRDLLVYREGLERRWIETGAGGRAAWSNLEPEVEVIFSEHMGRDPRATHPYRVGVLAGQAQRFTKRQLHECLKLAVDAHESLVSSRVAPEATLERFLVRAMAT